MRRRRFIELCAGGAAVGLLGCLPDTTTDTGRSVRIVRDGGEPPPDPLPGTDGGSAGGADAGSLPPSPDGGGMPPPDSRDAGTGPEPDAGTPCDDYVLMHDTHAQSLYFDGGHGPLTGIVRVDWVAAGDAVELEFWHGHGGRNHRFTVGPEHFEALKRGERVMIETTEVDSHSHQLFIDPTDERYRVEGAEDVRVPLC